MFSGMSLFCGREGSFRHPGKCTHIPYIVISPDPRDEILLPLSLQKGQIPLLEKEGLAKILREPVWFMMDSLITAIAYRRSLNLGLRASRSPSPKRLKARTTTRMAKPGTKVNQGASKM